MAKTTSLDRHWRELMFYCQQESEYRRAGTHPKLLKLVTAHLESLAREMGFSERQIRTREFRAERRGEKIVRIIADA